MKKEVKLNDAQLEALAPYEKYFGTAIRSGYSQHPGANAIETMRGVWAELTGQKYPMNLGCTRCLMNLLKDIGTLYFNATGIDPYAKVQRIVKTYPRPAAAPAAATPAPKAENTPENSETEAEGTTTPPKTEKPKTAAKKGKNTKK